MTVFSEEFLKFKAEAPDKWWNELTWIEKDSVKSIIELATIIGDGSLTKTWGNAGFYDFKEFKRENENGS